MSYYILPKINNQILINPSINLETKIQPYISHSLLHYVNLITCQINNNIVNSIDLSFNDYNEIVKLINPCEYIFSKVSGSKYSVSKLKPSSNLFYDFLEVCSVFNVFENYADSFINSLHISENISDTIECFEILRENYDDKIICYNSFSKETIEEINSSDKKFDFLLFERKFEDLNSYFIFLKNCLLTIFKCQLENGSCIIKIDDTFYKPVIDFMYILSSLYDKVYILKPNSSNITTYEKYIVCKKYHVNMSNTHLSEVNYSSLNKILDNDIIYSLLNFDIPYYFISKIDDINVIIGHQQIESLNSIINLLKNKNKEDRIEALKKTNLIKSTSWCEKHKIPYNKFSEKINIFLPLVNRGNEEDNNNNNNNELSSE